MNVSEAENFRSNLRWYMDELAISQADFAVAANIALPNLNRILVGKAVPRLDTTERIAATCIELFAQQTGGEIDIKARSLMVPHDEFMQQFEEILQPAA
jgi:predicted transcriptional regulator